ncbi:MAG: repair protein RadC [Labilithrix sp.]|nr:repair protein RadC [Labilithrix sp.]
MAKLARDIEAWTGEELLDAVLASRRDDGRRASTPSELATGLLAELGGFAGLSRATIDELEAHLSVSSKASTRAGVKAKARRLAAAFEVGRRAASEAATPERISSSADVAKWAATRLSSLDHEELWLLALDGRSRLLAVRCVARGGLHGMGVRAADPIRLALRAAATAFVLVHNHPSGDPTPSAEDISFTKRVAAAAAVVGTPLVDHVVVTRVASCSVPLDAESVAVASGAVYA